METRPRHFADSIERWTALILAAAVTLLLFAAIDAGFTVHGADPAKIIGATRNSASPGYAA